MAPLIGRPRALPALSGQLPHRVKEALRGARAGRPRQRGRLVLQENTERPRFGEAR
jgi:hypothetical protein